MPDAPTVGGYPVIGVVHSADLGRLAQRLPGEPVRFVEISILGVSSGPTPAP
jgi:allophanate hydrolase subunit 2